MKGCTRRYVRYSRIPVLGGVIVTLVLSSARAVTVSIPVEVTMTLSAGAAVERAFAPGECQTASVLDLKTQFHDPLKSVGISASTFKFDDIAVWLDSVPSSVVGTGRIRIAMGTRPLRNPGQEDDLFDCGAPVSLSSVCDGNSVHLKDKPDWKKDGFGMLESAVRDTLVQQLVLYIRLQLLGPGDVPLDLDQEGIRYVLVRYKIQGRVRMSELKL